MSDQHPRPWRVEKDGPYEIVVDAGGKPVARHDGREGDIYYGNGVAGLIVAVVNAYEAPTERERFMDEWENQTLSPEEADAMIASMEVFRGFRGTDPEADMPLPDPRPQLDLDSKREYTCRT